jgi:hypothetical protein
MHEDGYFRYIMASRSHTLYIGVTSDLHKRVFQPNQERRAALERPKGFRYPLPICRMNPYPRSTTSTGYRNELYLHAQFALHDRGREHVCLQF